MPTQTDQRIFTVTEHVNSKVILCVTDSDTSDAQCEHSLVCLYACLHTNLGAYECEDKQ